MDDLPGMGIRLRRQAQNDLSSPGVYPRQGRVAAWSIYHGKNNVRRAFAYLGSCYTSALPVSRMHRSRQRARSVTRVEILSVNTNSA